MRMKPSATSAACIWLALAACAPAPAAPPPGPMPGAPADAGASDAQPSDLAMARQVAELVNEHRVRVGCPALVWDQQAAHVAQAHSDDMWRRGYFSHISAGGRTVGVRLRSAGVDWRTVAENIAMGQSSARQAVDGWLSSEGHRRNIEDCSYRRTGVGVRAGLWTQIFFTPP
jgi:uncharacterized protein YkwD